MGPPFPPALRRRSPLPSLQAPPPLDYMDDEGLLPQIAVGARRPDSVGPAGRPPSLANEAEIQAPVQQTGATRNPGTVPLISPREEHEDPENFRGSYQQSYQTPQEVSLGDWAKEVQSREGPPKLAANSSVRTYTNKDLDEVVRENRGSTMQVHSSSTIDQDEFDLDRREAREDTEYRAGQAGLNAYINDPDGSKAREEQYQRQLGIARVQASGRQRQDELDFLQNQQDRALFAEEAQIDAQVTAGTITAAQAEVQKNALQLAHAREVRKISEMRQQRQMNKNSRQGLIFADDEDPPVIPQ